MACPGDHTLHLFLDGTLAPGDRGGVRDHVAGCESCRQLLVELGKADHTVPSPASTPSRQAPWPPAQLDEYRLVRRLGAGAMGEVYLAQDTRLDRLVAIKFIARPSPEAKERLMREARSVALLQHPNVADVYRAGELDGHPYLVSEFVDGGTLGDAPRPMPAAKVVALGIALARGLAAAHAKGVLHRDIKLHNVMLAKDGTLKLVDFGLARAEADDVPAALGGDASLTHTGALVGTPRYLAPERWEGKPASPQSDLYAFGTVLYELLAGAPPYQATTLDEHRRLVAAGDPKPLSGVPRALAAVVERCLARDPAQRFAAAADAADALERIARPARGWVLPASLAVLAVAALAVGLFFRGALSPGARQLAEAKRLWKDGSTAPALRTLARAVEAEPELGAAWLWSAFLEPDPAVARKHFAQAMLYRGSLDGDDAALLEALEPGQAPNPDLGGWFTTVDTRRPMSGVLQLLRARVLFARLEPDAAKAALRDAETRDPSLAVQVAARLAAIDRGSARAGPALEGYARCLALSKRSTDCLAGQVLLEGRAGRCAQMERDARFWSSVDPQDERAWDALANALFFVRAPWPSIEEAVRARAATSKADRARLEAEGELTATLAKGDFAGALKRAEADLAAVPPDAGLMTHIEVAYTVVLIAREMGDSATVVRVARAFLDRAQAWTFETPLQNATTLLFAWSLFHEGAMTAAELDAHRTRVLTGVPPTFGIWLMGWGGGARTREGAVEAFALLPKYGTLPTPGTFNSAGELVVGTVLAQAGRYSEALPYLTHVSASCYQLENPVAYVMGLTTLGEALEATGDTAGARAAWQRAVDLYGKTPSIHAAKAAERLKQLR